MAELPDLRGTRILLRQPIDDDIAIRLKIPADPELHRMYGGSGAPIPTTLENVSASLRVIADQDTPKVRHFVIAALVDPNDNPIDADRGQYIGHIRLTFTSEHDRSGRVALGIYDRGFWSRGYGTEALRILLGYAFDELGLHRVDLHVIEYNTRAIRSYEKCGFIREGFARECALVDDVWYGDVLMSILESEFRAQPWADGFTLVGQ